jgi:hypothetical protein
MKGYNLMPFGNKRIALMLLLIFVFVVSVHEEEGYSSADVCCSQTSKDPDCYQQLMGPGSIYCSASINCAGPICALTVATRSISIYSECTSPQAYSWVGTYAANTEIHAEGETHGNYGQIVCEADYWLDCLTGRDNGSQSCYGPCG